MENASKALLIAAGIFFGLMIITISLFMHNQISNYYETKETSRLTEQMATFNAKYLIYQKQDLRGSDLLSLINKIIDFNKSKRDEEPEIEISIKIGNSAKAKEIYYQFDTYKNIKLINLTTIYTEDNSEAVLNEANAIESEYTKGIAEKLAANVSTLLGQNSSKTRQQLLEEYKIITTIDNEKILKYYQYQQFKRAHFDCKITKFTDTGRVQKFEATFNQRIQ